MWLAASQETLHRLIDELERSAGEAAARDFDATPSMTPWTCAWHLREGPAARSPRHVGQAVDEMVGKPVETLVFELAEPDAIGGVADVEVEHGPDQGEAAGLAGEAADHLGAPFDLA
jgi:hypothetical protein